MNISIMTAVLEDYTSDSNFFKKNPLQKCFSKKYNRICFLERNML